MEGRKQRIGPDANVQSRWGPSKSPMDMSPNEFAQWTSHLKTPVIFNHHVPVKVGATSIQHVDLNPIKSTRRALANEERILICTPLKDASQFLPRYFQLLSKLTYPHRLIDLAFLISDSTDDTLAVLAFELDRLQRQPGDVPFNSAVIIEKDFNFHLSQEVADRHSFEAQGPRRKALGKARNYLLATALKPEHSWVYWRDVDIQDCPDRILEDFIAHDKDIIVPSKTDHGANATNANDSGKTSGSTESRRARTSRDDVSYGYDFGRRR